MLYIGADDIFSLHTHQLQIAKDAVAEILDGGALTAGKLSEQQLNAKNALKIGRIGFKMPSP